MKKRHSLFASTSNATLTSNITPQKNSSVNFKGKSPGRTTSSTTTTNESSDSKIPMRDVNGEDRFIPNRTSSNFDLGHYKFKLQSNVENDRQKVLSEVMHLGDVNQRSMFSYQEKAPPAVESYQDPLRVAYSIKMSTATDNGARFIPTSSERTLDAPNLINDYYLNLLDWSVLNIVSIALGNIVYLWNAGNGNTVQLRIYQGEDYGSSLAWNQDGNILAIGSLDGTIELWDPETKVKTRVMNGHTDRVGAVAWNSSILSSGSRDGSIIHHDVRIQDHKVNTLIGHTQEVCGLKWSTDFRYLASGGNDNIVNIWPGMMSSNPTGNIPRRETEILHVLDKHKAAVRALAWCPWTPNILATGGGTADRSIKFWNINNGNLLHSIDTNSQVCSLMWSKTYNELISAHGANDNQMSIWKYPSMAKQCDLTGHTGRVLQMAMSPDGSKVMSAAADETLRLWNCFAPEFHQAKKEKPVTIIEPSILRPNMR